MKELIGISELDTELKNGFMFLGKKYDVTIIGIVRDNNDLYLSVFEHGNVNTVLLGAFPMSKERIYITVSKYFGGRNND